MLHGQFGMPMPMRLELPTTTARPAKSAKDDTLVFDPGYAWMWPVRRDAGHLIDAS